MTGYNKLKIAILAIMTSQTVNAITIDPIQVQSGAGELLYAEMKFSNSNPSDKIEAGLASADDIQNIGVATQTPGHLNFYTRRSNDGSGVIVITSSRPLIDSELNILVKIKEGNATHLKQIKTPLTRGRNNVPAPMLKTAANEKPLMPQVIVSEKDIALNLPTSTQYKSNVLQAPSTANTQVDTSPMTNAQRPLTISVIAPPTLNTQTSTVGTTTQTPPTTPVNNSPTIRNDVVKIETPKVVETPVRTQILPQREQTQPEKNQTNTAQAVDTQPSQNTDSAPHAKSQPKQPETHKVQKNENKRNENNKVETYQANDKNPQHVVQANESLWKIASRIAAETHQSIPDVMRQIKENNRSAFIQGDVNRIRRGAALNLAASYQQTPPTKYKVPTQAPVVTQKQSGAAKYRLDQAEMSLVADNEQNSAQGSAKKNTQINQTNDELSTKVMTSREKTVKLQKNVTQLASALQQKNQRIQLLNARLAQLQQQLKDKSANKPNS
ncbi:type IV pilus assembly protein FimV [Acinetobacter wuhouensis]|uniref:FimV N-terminal domain-containing protein n=1 Tax=Acinetobacter wuhouensis TaxID=1879050 RepID=A0A4Q7AJS9_9GAMM|nr:hypothetical protein [Acinetobacter wuhouensis]RZG49009.1 hypothetical protein EXU28_01350 [Acinetobacter wuhouensis]